MVRLDFIGSTDLVRGEFSAGLSGKFVARRATAPSPARSASSTRRSSPSPTSWARPRRKSPSDGRSSKAASPSQSRPTPTASARTHRSLTSRFRRYALASPSRTELLPHSQGQAFNADRLLHRNKRHTEPSMDSSAGLKPLTVTYRSCSSRSSTPATRVSRPRAPSSRKIWTGRRSRTNGGPCDSNT